MPAENPNVSASLPRDPDATRSGAPRAAESTIDHATASSAPGGDTTIDRNRTALHKPTPESNGQPELPAGYEYLSRLGRGGMGVVYRVRHLSLNRIVALKMMLSGSHAAEAERVRFQREAEAVAQLDHPNIVKVFEVGEFAGVPFFTLEYITGGTLETAASNPLAARDAATLMVPIARALAHAHAAGIVHRDLKPANILLAGVATDDSGSEMTDPAKVVTMTPKVTDFGLAKTIDQSEGLTASGALLGTPNYMAPEQARGDIKNVGAAADIHALGATLYRLVTGRPPYAAPSVMATLRLVTSSEPPTRRPPSCPACRGTSKPSP